MADLKMTKHAFGSKENIETAKEQINYCENILSD